LYQVAQCSGKTVADQKEHRIESPVDTGFPLMFAFALALMVSSPSRRDTMKEAIGYVRVSSEEQAESGLGLEAQRQRIIAFCDMKGLRLAEVYEDAGVSGGKPLSSRPAGSRLINAARRGKVVVVAKLDRLFRSVADVANVIAEFDKKGIELIAIAEGFDMTTPYGRAMVRTVFQAALADSATCAGRLGQ
jgi:hypothetical protein